MPAPISALEHRPNDFVREVSPEAINFYVDGLSGIHLPEEFVAANPKSSDVRSWGSEDRLEGKFGRYALKAVKGVEEVEEEPINDFLIMGTTIGLSGLDRDGFMASLRHHMLDTQVWEILRERKQSVQDLYFDRADYGSTAIRLDADGIATRMSVYGASYDFGRAKSEGRQRTCDMFARVLGDSIQIINVDPSPREHERIVS